MRFVSLFFFFQAEDGIRCRDVTGVQTCALPILARPARYELRSWTTVLDALALAGGFTPFAAKSRVVILRPNGNGMERIPFDYPKIVKNQSLLDRITGGAGGEQENFYLKNGDIIFVP